MSTTDITNINNIGLFFIVVMGILTMILPRRLVLMPLLFSVCYMTLGQQFVIGTAHFSIMRIIILFVWMRLVLRRDYFPLTLNSIDKTIICWVIVSVAVYALLWQSSQAIKNRLGFAYDVIGIYFLFRFFIRDFDDIYRTLKIIAIIVTPLIILILIESTTGRNLFSVFGGVPEFTAIRGGKLRCQGPFAHPILAGTFGATLLPLLVGFWFKKTNSRLLGIVGAIAATIIVITSASTGPLMTYLAGITGLVMWRFRKHMRIIRWGMLFVVLSLHIVMKAPVWALIGRVGEIIGGGGWHRVGLIDTAVSHFDEWWLFGTKSTAHWLSETLVNNPNMVDITNQFIRESVDGGLLKVILFIIIIALCFRGIGRTLQVMKEQPFSNRILVWSMGATLFAHVTAFISVSYFDQMVVLWYLLLAMISTVSSLSKELKIPRVAA
jgi:hypothetical protein